MIKFNEFLAEGRDAPLYHGSTFHNGIRIIKDGIIDPKTTQNIKITRGALDTRLIKGVSLTRNLSFAKRWVNPDTELQTKIIFVIDQGKLSRSRKIIPFNFHNSGSLAYSSDSVARQTDKPYYLQGAFDPQNEYEEFVIGSIPSEYWTEIRYYAPMHDQIQEYLVHLPPHVKVSSYDKV